ncbi:hypothetical protein [Mycolicibacterium novocastrense]|uniref:Uncharacterized protein n=1 Tax=Mycolicibacterium novocastrense TaxID=59813 RepID=A0ABQ0KRL6_MYCNV|nr:hypothetical protein [Mycolicibacterium novocastrense]GAT11764.1 uncharacterized protein RMCN_4897 [Mycolicibacterium novocastrense]
MTTYTRPGAGLTDVHQHLAMPPFDGEGLGINTEGDVLVNTTADGVDVNALWCEVQSVLSAWNAERGETGSDFGGLPALACLLTLRATSRPSCQPPSK